MIKKRKDSVGESINVQIKDSSGTTEIKVISQGIVIIIIILYLGKETNHKSCKTRKWEEKC